MAGDCANVPFPRHCLLGLTYRRNGLDRIATIVPGLRNPSACHSLATKRNIANFGPCSSIESGHANTSVPPSSYSQTYLGKRRRAAPGVKVILYFPLMQPCERGTARQLGWQKRLLLDSLPSSMTCRRRPQGDMPGRTLAYRSRPYLLRVSKARVPGPLQVRLWFSR
jgi:hypothetical protein